MRTTSGNYPNHFPFADDGIDQFKKEDVQSLAAAVELHDHTGPGGNGGVKIGVGSLGNGVATGAALGADVVTLTAVQAITGQKTFTALTLLGATAPTGAGRVGFSTPFMNVGDGVTNHPIVDTNSVQTISGQKSIVNPILQTVPLLWAHIDNGGLALNTGCNQSGSVGFPTLIHKMIGFAQANYAQFQPLRHAYYVVGATVLFDRQPSGNRGVAIVVNGTSYVAATVVPATAQFGNALSVVTQPILLDTTDTIEMQIYADAFNGALSPVTVTIPSGATLTPGIGDLWAICYSGDTT